MWGEVYDNVNEIPNEVYWTRKKRTLQTGGASALLNLMIKPEKGLG